MFIQAFDFKNQAKEVIMQILASLLFERHEIIVHDNKESEKESEEDDHSSELNNRDISPTYKRLLKFCKKQRNKNLKKREMKKHNRKVAPQRKLSDLKKLYIEGERQNLSPKKVRSSREVGDMSKIKSRPRKRQFCSKLSNNVPNSENFSSMAAFRIRSGLNAKNSTLEQRKKQQNDDSSSIDLIELKLH